MFKVSNQTSAFEKIHSFWKYKLERFSKNNAANNVDSVKAP